MLHNCLNRSRSRDLKILFIDGAYYDRVGHMLPIKPTAYHRGDLGWIPAMHATFRDLGLGCGSKQGQVALALREP